MFKSTPKVFAHLSVLDHGNFVTPEYILNKNNNIVNLFRRFCPHRKYPLGEPGSHIDNITCKFHNFQWDKNGIPINNDRHIVCGNSNVGLSGLIFKDFTEPDHFWVKDLQNEKNLNYSHSMYGESKGSWLWMMEIQADLLHVWKDGIHPTLSAVTNLDDIEMYDGDGWILQTCATGWWLFIYPFTFIEWSKGCLSVNYTIPNNVEEEFDFKWTTQFYYDKNISEEKRRDFETLEDVFREDVSAVEKQNGKWFPILKPYNRLENHCVHYGDWVLKNKLDK